MRQVRSVVGVPAVALFNDSGGTPIIVNTLTGHLYVLLPGDVVYDCTSGGSGTAGSAGASVVGMDGEDGADGMPVPGTPGPAGSAGAQGLPGASIVEVDGLDGEDGFHIPGDKGATGAPGIPGFGMDGEDGSDGMQIPPAPVTNPIIGTFTPGSFTIPTGQYVDQMRRLQLTGSQRLTAQGTGHLSIAN